jgi:hypothetical protein
MGRAVLITALMLFGASIVADSINDRTDIELGTAVTVFGIAFGAWSVLLGWVMLVVRREFQELKDSVREEAQHRRNSDDRAHQDRIVIERRISEMEAALRFAQRRESSV